jgi:hypothetical protein
MVFNHNTFPSLGKIKHGLPQQSIVGTLFSLCFTHNWPKTITNNSKSISFEDDSSKIVTNPNVIHFKNDI